ncbi:MAG: hypothetical protein JNM36_17740, partial [Chitinophagales bacterium]|nr:hypothetical protein [Chitinophagales bacterium]
MLNNNYFLKKTILLSLNLLCFSAYTYAQVSGTVFRDFNANGIKDNTSPFNEIGLAGVTVTAYNTVGTSVGTATSAANGTYTIAGVSGAVRVEFTVETLSNCLDTNIDYPSGGGGSYGSSVQFVNAPISSVNFAVNNPADYNTGTTGINVFIPRHIKGDPLPAGGSSGSQDWFVGFPYTSSGTTAPSQKLSGQVIGSTWGVAYSKQAQKLFTSAFLKRHAGLGVMGSGGIYMLEPTATSFNVTQFYDMDANGHRTRADNTAPAYGSASSFNINLTSGNGTTVTYLGSNDPLTGLPSGLGVIGTNIERQLSTNMNATEYDPAAFDQVGKVGIGDIDISDDGKYLFLTNLYSRKVFRLTLNDAYNPTTVIAVDEYSLPTTAVTNGVLRPFALKFANDRIFVGAVATAELGGSTSNLFAYVFELNNATGVGNFSSTPVISFPLNYVKGPSSNNLGKSWNPWTANAGSGTHLFTFGGVDGYTHPTPILSDIEFTENQDIILTFLDRSGHQWGSRTRKFLSVSSLLVDYRIGGDVLVAGKNCTSGSYTIENNGSFTSSDGTVYTSGSSNTEGPGGSEFFKGDKFDTNHRETSQGATAVLKGTQNVLLTVMDPLAFYSGGLQKLSTVNGDLVAGTPYQLYISPEGSADFAFGKANGLGDIELTSTPAPLEIGNRVWNDVDSDGIQDAGETGIGNVSIELYADFDNNGTPDGVALATTTTSTTVGNMLGTWYFNTTNVTDGDPSVAGNQAGPQPNKRYLVRIGSADWTGSIGAGDLLAKSLTTANVGGAGQPDVRDSDAALSATIPTISVLLGDAGENNHTYDFGFTTAPLCTISGCEVYADTIRIVSDEVNYTTPDAQGRTWDSYQKYSLEGSRWDAGNVAISNLSSGGSYSTTSIPDIYQNSLYLGYMDWHFTVPNGSYTVVLHFSEPSFTSANQRLFDILLEKTIVESKFDLFVAAGNQRNRAITKAYPVTVADGDLQMQFKATANNALVNAIEIIPNYCKATQTVSITDVDVSGCYLNSSGQSKATVSVEVAWEGLYPSDSIQVSAGSLIRWIYPGQYKTPGSVGSIISPQVIAFEVDANGTNGTIAAQIVNNSNCSPATSVYTLPAACPANTCSSGSLGGMVFNDYNADGIQQSGETFGTGGVTVTVFDSNGATFSTTSDINGLWTISNPLTYPVRVEFSNLPTYVGDNGTVNGTNGQTTVQFVAAASCSVNLGVLNGTDYCQAVPDIFIPVYVNGNPLVGGTSATQTALKRMPYGTNGNVISSGTTSVATAAQVGSLWGVAYDKKRNKIYTSAILRRHAGLGPQGLGGIYVTDVNTNATSNFVDVQATLGVNVGSMVSGDPFFGQTNGTRNLPSNINGASHDSLVFVLTGKVGIGDMDISDDNNSLYFVNLFDKVLYKLDISGASPVLVGSYPIPSACGTSDANRPFGLKVKNGKVYIATLCDGYISQNVSEMRAYIYSFDESLGAFSPIFDFPLNYPKGFCWNGIKSIGAWNPWTDDFQTISSTSVYPQPMFTDIEIDLDGSLILGFSDRTALQGGWRNYGVNSNNTSLFTISGAGDFLRAAYINGTYVLENNGYVAGYLGYGPNNNQGPGFGEFYNDNFYWEIPYNDANLVHSEIAFGALAIKPGSGQTIYTAMDPLNEISQAGGFRYISNITGTSASGNATGAMIYRNTTNATESTFGKSVGLGDIELACRMVSYLEIGNYVWIDTDADGVQDPTESGIPNVQVRLYNQSGLLVGLTTTDANGEYYFNPTNVDNNGVNTTTGAATVGYTGLAPNTQYFIVLGQSGTNTFNATNNVLNYNGNKYTLTNVNTGEGSVPDQNDSDASLASGVNAAFNGYPYIVANTGDVGSVD